MLAEQLLHERGVWNLETSPNLHQKHGHGKFSPADSFHCELIYVENSSYTFEKFANKNLM